MSSSHTLVPTEGILDSAQDRKHAADAIKKAFEDNDVQTVFYLNQIPEACSITTEIKDTLHDFEVMKENWATKIEQTVQKQVDSGNPKLTKAHTLQAGFDRASYRAKLIQFLPKTTPWLHMELDETSKPFTAELKEDYHHDKAVYQKAVHDILQAHIADVPEGRRRYIEKYIAEILVLSLHNLSNVQRFTIAYVSLNEHEGALRSAICTVTIEFEYKKIDPKTVGVEISRNVYKAILNRKLFEEQEFDQKMLDLGRPIVQAWTIDIATQDV